MLIQPPPPPRKWALPPPDELRVEIIGGQLQLQHLSPQSVNDDGGGSDLRPPLRRWQPLNCHLSRQQLEEGLLLPLLFYYDDNDVEVVD